MNTPQPLLAHDLSDPELAPANRQWRLGRHFFAIGAAGLLLMLVVAALMPTRRAGAVSEQTAHIIVQFDNAARNVASLSFTDPISGLRALQLAGFEVITVSTSFGPAVCSIEGVGCPATDCFCNASKYWGYSYWDGVAWQSYMVGAGTSVISQTGAIEGWRWGEFGDAITPASVTVAATSALSWLASSQSITNGGYGGASGAVETMLAIGSNNQRASAWQRSPASPSLESALLSTAAAYARQGPAASGKLHVALAAADSCKPSGVVAPSTYYSSTLRAYSPNAADNAWAILGTVAVSESVPAAALSTLKGLAQSNGGWEWGTGWGVDTNATALAVQALIVAGEAPTSTVIVDALAYLKSTQNGDGGFPYALSVPSDPVAPSDSNSTAYVVQAIAATGQDPVGAAWQSGGKGPFDFLQSRQLANGSLEWQAGKGANLLATQQGIPALLGQAHPTASRTLRACPTAYLPLVTTAQ